MVAAFMFHLTDFLELAGIGAKHEHSLSGLPIYLTSSYIDYLIHVGSDRKSESISATGSELAFVGILRSDGSRTSSRILCDDNFLALNILECVHIIINLHCLVFIEFKLYVVRTFKLIL